jgi:hypothetical protein
MTTDPTFRTPVLEVAEMSAPRGWYLMLTNPDDSLDGLIGPVKGGREPAIRLKEMLLDRDLKLAEAVDWDHPDACAPYWFTYVRVVELSAAEIDALANTVKS